METVQLQCGNCRKLMAISIEHMGGQVQCPHCQSVVQTPPPAKQSTPAVQVPAMELPDQRESIFGDQDAGEDVVGGAPLPKLELPRVRVPAPEATIAEDAPATESEPADPETDLTTFKRRPIYDKSMMPLVFMIFLIPYAVMTTLFIIYLLMYPPSRGPHPLDMMPDPVPNKNKGAPRPGARQILHNQALAAHQKTTLGKQVRAGKDGDLIVIPERVVHTGDGNLQLVLRVRNTSATPFEPINDFYVLFRPSKRNDPDEARPFTFLESAAGGEAIYGGYLEYRKKINGKEEAVPSGVLGPAEEEFVVLTTMNEFQPDVDKLLKSDGTFTWRVQVRRGLVKYNGRQVSTTAVIAVEFTKQDVQELAKKT